MSIFFSAAVKPKSKATKQAKKNKPVPSIGEGGVEDDEAEDLGIFEGNPKSDEKSSDEKDSDEEQQAKPKDGAENDDQSPEDESNEDEEEEERDEPSKHNRRWFC